MIKSNASPTASILTLSIMLATQVVFILTPGSLIVDFNRILRPAIYAAIAIIYCVVTGKDERPVTKSRQSVLLSAIAALLYLAAIFITGLFFGFSSNIMFAGLSSLLWTSSVIIFTSEYLRAAIIKRSPRHSRTATAIILVLIFTFAQLDLLRNAAGFSFISTVDFTFTTVIPALALNGVLSYIAFEGSFSALLILRSTHTLCPLIMPVLPNAPRAAWASINCCILFITLILYYINIRDKNKRTRWLDRKRSRYFRTKNAAQICIPITLVALIVIFAMRGFSYFPVIVLTDSMRGSLDRGSIVFVEKLEFEDVHDAVSAGDIILYTHRDIEMMHRVIEFRHNSSGERIYITKGDANDSADTNPIEAWQILGISKAYIPYLGYPAVIAREWGAGS